MPPRNDGPVPPPRNDEIRLMSDTPHRIPVRPRAVVSDITTANDEVREAGVRAIRRRRPVVTAGTLKVVGAITPATVA